MRSVLAVVMTLAACSASDPAHDAGVDQTPQPRANGTVGDWRKLTPMPLAIANHCSAVVGGYLVIVGGTYKTPSGDFLRSDVVRTAHLEADGGLGPWIEAGRTLSPVQECVATGYRDQLIVVDGIYDNGSDRGQVWAATVGSDGKLTLGGEWTSWASLPEGRYALSGSAWIVEDQLAAISLDSGDPNDPNSPTAVLVLRAPIGDGKLGAWSIDKVLGEFRGRAQYAADAGGLWIVGGYYSGAAEVSKTVFVSTKAPGGPYGISTETASLPEPRTFGAAAAADGWVFLAGGRTGAFGGGESAQIMAAQADASGKLGPWQQTSVMPEPRTNDQAVIGGNYLYVTGGSGGGPIQNTVFAAQIRF